MILSLDIGTTGTKALLINHKGEIYSSGYAPHKTFTSEEGWIEQNPAEWWMAVSFATKQALKNLTQTDLYKILAITICGQMQDLILLDAEKHLNNALLYSDSRATHEILEIETNFGKNKLIEISGNIQKANSPFAKWLWLKNYESAKINACQYILFGAHDYIASQLCDTYSIDFTTASTTGFLNLKNKDWDKEFLAFLHLNSEILPKIQQAGSIVGYVSKRAANFLELPAGIPVFQGTGDLAALIAITGNNPHIYLGTSGWIAIPKQYESRNPDIFTAIHPDAKRYIHAVPQPVAGKQLEFFYHTEKYSRSNEQLANSHFPTNFSDLSLDTTAHENYSATMKNIAMAYRTSLDLLEILDSQSLFLTGGGANSSRGCQIISNILGHSITVPTHPSYTVALGAASLVSEAIGWNKDIIIDEIFAHSYTYQPQILSDLVSSQP